MACATTDAHTAQLAEIQQKRDELEKYIMTLCHELRTPLNGNLGMIQLAVAALEREREPPPGVASALAQLKQAQRSGASLLALIEEPLHSKRTT